MISDPFNYGILAIERHSRRDNMDAAPNNVGQRPVSKTESSNPREFQLNQIRRRFRPAEETTESGTTLRFGMAPSDPDFPFELDKLQCILHVPLSYPARGRPTLKVANPEIDDAFRDNVARGFDDIVDSTMRSGGRGTLLSWMNSLDRHLERLLTTTERGPTLKFVPNLGGQQKNNAPDIVDGMKSVQISEKSKPHIREKQPASKPTPVYTAEEKAQAERRRVTETKQIEARLGRLPFFAKSNDGLSFTVPIQPAKVNLLPIPLRSVKTMKLLVPELYPLEPSAVELQGVDGEEAEAVQLGFAQWTKANAQLNLMSQINYLTSNMHSLAKTPLQKDSISTEEPRTSAASTEGTPSNTPTTQLEDKPHLHVVPRPPEWAVGEDGSDNEETEDSSDFDDDYSDEDEDGGAPVPNMPEATKEHGVALSFPFLELYGIELLELVGLCITVKCERCKEPTDVKNVPQIKEKGDGTSPKVETCKKCANTMSLGMYHLRCVQNMVHYTEHPIWAQAFGGS